MAMMPANTPGPTIATSSNAQISALIERDETMTRSAIGRTTVTLGVVLRAARNAIGTATMIASSVPTVAMFIVSQSGRQSSGR